MVTQPRKQITLRIATTQQLDQYKLISKESYDSIINRMLEHIREENNDRR